MFKSQLEPRMCDPKHRAIAAISLGYLPYISPPTGPKQLIRWAKLPRVHSTMECFDLLSIYWTRSGDCMHKNRIILHLVQIIIIVLNSEPNNNDTKDYIRSTSCESQATSLCAQLAAVSWTQWVILVRSVCRKAFRYSLKWPLLSIR